MPFLTKVKCLMQLSVCFFMSFFPLDVKDMPKGMKSTTYAQKFPSYPYSGNPEQQSNDASFRYEKSVKLFIKLPRIQACMIHMNDDGTTSEGTESFESIKGYFLDIIFLKLLSVHLGHLF